MSVVTSQARRRWAVVTLGVAALVAVPVAASAVQTALRAATTGAAARTASGDETAARQRLAGALASAGVAHQGLAESRGGLAVPDLPRLGEVTAPLGDTTRLRVWWDSTRRWRVDRLTTTGEQDVYGGTERGANGVAVWDYEDNRLTETIGATALRLPRADDLLPPQAARRLLGGVGPDDDVRLTGGDVVAGRPTVGLRVRPADARSTIAAVDVQLDAATDLPLAMTVRDAGGVTALQTRFTDLTLAAPDGEALRIPAAPGARVALQSAADPLGGLSRGGAWNLPPTLAGLPSSEPLVSGGAAYGDGLVAFVVLPLSPRYAARTLDALRTAPAVELPGARARLVTSGPVSVLLVAGQDRRHSYLVSGLVTADVLAQAARGLLAAPAADPERRF